MIVVDDEVELKLKDLLKNFLHEPSEMAEIRLRFPEEMASERLRAEVPLLIQRQIEDENARIFFLEDGSVLIIAANLYMREASKLASMIFQQMGLPPQKCGMEYHDLRNHAGKHLQVLEKFHADEIRRKQEAEAAHLAQQAEVQIALKRRAILDNSVPHEEKIKLAERRKQRASSEIMIIEDDAFSRRLISNTLGKDYKLTSLGDAETALATYATVAPDILFLDINLPMVTGHELLEKILQIDPEAFVVMLSGNADQKNVTEAMKRGAKGFVAKPFTPEKLHQYIQRCPTIQ